MKRKKLVLMLKCWLILLRIIRGLILVKFKCILIIKLRVNGIILCRRRKSVNLYLFRLFAEDC